MSKLKVMQDGKWINFEDSIFYEKVLEKNILLQQRIDDAIDFIQIYSKHYQDRINHNDLIRIKKLLDILRGEDDE